MVAQTFNCYFFTPSQKKPPYSTDPRYQLQPVRGLRKRFLTVFCRVTTTQLTSDPTASPTPTTATTLWPHCFGLAILIVRPRTQRTAGTYATYDALDARPRSVSLTVPAATTTILGIHNGLRTRPGKSVRARQDGLDDDFSYGRTLESQFETDYLYDTLDTFIVTRK